MKKIIALIFVLVLAFAVVGCNAEPAHDHDHNHDHSKEQVELASNTEHVVHPITKGVDFSFEKDKAKYTEGLDGVQTKDFKNTEKTEYKTIPEAIELAKKECTVEYDSVNVYYDKETEVCMVNFYNETRVGHDQSVYLDKDGKTLLIVYGEQLA